MLLDYFRHLLLTAGMNLALFLVVLFLIGVIVLQPILKKKQTSNAKRKFRASIEYEED
ncbi:MAG: hypothetical protein HOO91_12205 [Bacteroidales bacterium]|nr:hypothetical protein [Bacteroidales bacterium]